jgi:glyoxylase I family protein
MSAPFIVREIDHVVLATRDPARLEAFYTRILGCPVEKRQPRFGLTQLRAGRALIDLVESKDAAAGDTRARNMEHLCLRIEPFDGPALRAYLEERGLEVGDIADRYGAEGRGPSLYIADPDGNKIELKGPSSSRD